MSIFVVLEDSMIVWDFGRLMEAKSILWVTAQSLTNIHLIFRYEFLTFFSFHKSKHRVQRVLLNWTWIDDFCRGGARSPPNKRVNWKSYINYSLFIKYELLTILI